MYVGYHQYISHHDSTLDGYGILKTDLLGWSIGFYTTRVNWRSNKYICVAHKQCSRNKNLNSNSPGDNNWFQLMHRVSKYHQRLSLSVLLSRSVSLYIPLSQFLPDGKRMISGASSGEFTLWSGNSFTFETNIQVWIIILSSSRTRFLDLQKWISASQDTLIIQNKYCTCSSLNCNYY